MISSYFRFSFSSSGNKESLTKVLIPSSSLWTGVIIDKNFALVILVLFYHIIDKLVKKNICVKLGL